MIRWALLAAGGVAGTFARYVVASSVMDAAAVPFPLGTFAVNASACFLVGLFDAVARERGPLGPQGRLLLVTGFCGAYSTFSSWILESSNLLRAGQSGLAFLNVAASACVGFALFACGAWLGARL